MINEQFSIIWGTRSISYPKLVLYAAGAVKQFKGLGIKPLERIALCDDNSIEYLVVLLALWQIKAVAVPINPRWPQKTISAYMGRVNATSLLSSVQIKRLVCFDARQQAEQFVFKEPQEDQDVTIIATSASSGEPKAALHTWGNHVYSAKGAQELIALGAQDRWLLSLPLYHVSGMAILIRCLISGAGLVLPAEAGSNTQALIEALEKSKATHLSLVSTQLQRLLEDERNLNVLRSLKCILLGGSAIPAALMTQAVSSGLKIHLTYGLTEMSSQVATGAVSGKGQACVKALPYRQIKISNEGEILVKGEVLFKGYVSGAKLNLPLVGPGDWFATGDMGQIDKEGCLTVTGRRDNMFISGGENIYPEEIEKALLKIKGIAQAVVVPKEDKDFGHRPVAFIQYAGEPLSTGDMILDLQAELPRFKIPASFLPWPQELMGQGLKIARGEFVKVLARL